MIYSKVIFLFMFLASNFLSAQEAQPVSGQAKKDLYSSLVTMADEAKIGIYNASSYTELIQMLTGFQQFMPGSGAKTSEELTNLMNNYKNEAKKNGIINLKVTSLVNDYFLTERPHFYRTLGNLQKCTRAIIENSSEAQDCKNVSNVKGLYIQIRVLQEQIKEFKERHSSILTDIEELKTELRPGTNLERDALKLFYAVENLLSH